MFSLDYMRPKSATLSVFNLATPLESVYMLKNSVKTKSVKQVG